MPAESFQPAATIPDVIQRLEQIIADSRAQNSRRGYFAALYRKVTVQVHESVVAGDFENGERMERLDVNFANRYLWAHHAYQNQLQPTLSWALAFATAEDWHPLIIQHLLLGMNAHINLDLGIAAFEVSSGPQLRHLKRDFFKINEILTQLLDEVQDKISSVSPLFGWLDKVGGRTDEIIMNFSIKIARDRAWEFANELNTPGVDVEKLIAERDMATKNLGLTILNPGIVLRLFTFLARIFETSNVGKVIDALF